MRQATRPTEKYSVVGCKQCHNLWIVERGLTAYTECTRCLTSYKISKLRSFATTDCLEDAAAARAQILAERAGHLDEYQDEGGFYDQEERAEERLRRLDDVYRDEAEESVDRWDRVYRERAEKRLEQRFGPSGTPETTFDKLRTRYQEEAEEHLNEVATAADDEFTPAIEGSLELTCQQPISADVSVTVGDTAPTDVLRGIADGLQPAVVDAVSEGADGLSPTEFHDRLFALDLDTEGGGIAPNAIRWLVLRAAKGDEIAVSELFEGLRSPGTGQVPLADGKVLTELLKLGSTSPTVTVRVGDSFLDRRRDQRVDICEYLTTLADVADVTLVAADEELQRRLYKKHHAELGVGAECITPHTPPELSEGVGEALTELSVDSPEVDVLRFLAEGDSGTRTFRAIYEGLSEYAKSTLRGSFSKLRDLGLVERLGSQQQPLLELRPAGEAVLDRFDREKGQQATLEESTPTPQVNQQYVAHPSDRSPPSEGETDATGGGGLVQTTTLDRHERVAAVASAPDTGVGLVDHDIRRREDGRQGAIWCNTDEDRLVVSVDYWNPTQWAVTTALALSDRQVWSQLLTPKRLNEADVDLTGLWDVAGLGWCRREDSSEEFIDRLQKVARQEILALTSELHEAKVNEDDESDIRSKLCRKAVGLSSVVAALCRFTDVELVREIRLPECKRDYSTSHEGNRETLITSIARMAARDSFYGAFTTWKQQFETRVRKQCFQTPSVEANNPYGELVGSFVLVGPGVTALQADIERGLARPGELRDDAPEFAVPLSVQDRTDVREVAQEATRRMCTAKGLSSNEDAVSLLSALARTPYAITRALHYLGAEEKRPGRELRPDEIRYALREGLAPTEVLPDANPTVSRVVHALLAAEEPLSQSALADRAGVSAQSIRNNRDVLEAVGLLEVEEQGPGLPTLWRLPISFDRTELVTPDTLDADPVDTLYEVGLVTVDEPGRLADPDDPLGGAFFWPPDPTAILRELPLSGVWRRVLEAFTPAVAPEEPDGTDTKPVLIGPTPEQTALGDREVSHSAAD